MSGNVLWSYFVRGRQCPITSRRMCFCIINLAFVKYFGHNFNCSQMAIWPVWTCWLKNFQLFCCPPILKLPTSCPLRQYLCGSFYETFLSFLSFYKTGICRRGLRPLDPLGDFVLRATWSAPIQWSAQTARYSCLSLFPGKWWNLRWKKGNTDTNGIRPFLYIFIYDMVSV